MIGTLLVWLALTTRMINENGRGSHYFADSNSNEDPSVIIVECQVSTPHSRKPVSNTANGKFHIAILEQDANHKGSSAEAFLKLVKEHFYDENYTFRVIPGFIVQWGVRSAETIPSTPAKERIESDLDAVPKKESSSSWKSEEDFTGTEANRMHLLMRKENHRGTITMISGPTGQVFINLVDNRRLDNEGTIPFGVILENTGNNDNKMDKNSGMKLIDRIYHGYKGGQGQIPAIKNHDVATKFPEMGRIDKCYRLE